MHPKRKSLRKLIKIVWFSLAAVFMIWNWWTFQSRGLPKGTFQDGGNVRVIESEDKITFQSVQTDSVINVIFFQGGLTDPKAYAPLCRKIAEKGFTTHLIKMSWRLPQYDYQKIAKLFDLKSGRYVIGGHSQGGKMAAQFVYENPTLLKGLFLLGTSHPKKIDLSELNIPCIKLYGEKDGLASTEEVMENRNKLPKNTQLTLIQGANHSQFGYLGKLFLDNKPDISLEMQQQRTLESLINFFNKISNG